MKELQLYLSLHSSTIDPGNITRVLSIEPTNSCRIGEMRREGQTPFSENVWSFAIGKNSQLTFSNYEDEFLKIFELKREYLKQFSGECDIYLEIEISSNENISNIALSPNILNFLGYIGARLEFECT